MRISTKCSWVTGGAVAALILAMLAGVSYPAYSTGAQEEEEVAVPDEARPGAYLDEVIVTEEPSESAAITRLEAGEIDLYADGLTDSELYDQVVAAGLSYEESFGSYAEITFNPYGPVFDGTGALNPFSVPRVREAMNYLVDREFIAQEIYGGLAVPRYLPVTSAFPDYARLADVARSLELEYAHDPVLAEQIITEEMENLGAEMVNGVWHYDGEPVELLFVIRTEDERQEIGDYISAELEDIGFEVDRLYRTAAEASALWMSSAPSEGNFHLYTGGWITTVISRDQAANFDFFYTPRGLGQPLWQAYEPSDEFDDIADRLARREFSTLEERKDMFAEGLELAMEDSVRMWLVDQQSFTPMQPEFQVAADLGGGVSGAFLWPFTFRREGEVGGSANIAMPSILTEPWNPLDGSNWIFDMMLIRATGDQGTLPDPFTGLDWPQRIERAEVTVEEGLPVERTHDWVSLDTASQIDVPDDAWISWDPEAQEFVSVGEEHPGGLTARRRSVVYYPDDFYENVHWHDGSPISLGDIVLGFILGFDRAQEESPIFDRAQVPAYESFIQNFRGMRIANEDPLVIEWYSDTFFLDAEANVTTLFPYYAQGPGAWHTLATGIRAEAAEELAFSSDKADRLEVEWTNMIAGPSLEILEEHLNAAANENYIPYEPTLSQFIDSQEASERWDNLQSWYDEYDHFWVGIGPYLLEEAFPVEGTVQLTRNAAYADPADKWERFEEPQIADVDVLGPPQINAGEEAEFEISITYQGAPYAGEDLDSVSFLVFDSTGALAYVGDAEEVTDGTWTATLTADQTAEIEPGSTRVEVIASPLIVSIPTFESVEFVISE